MDKFLRLKIKTKLTFGIGLLFTMIVLLGGLAVQNITDMSSDTQNILADNYNSLLYSRRMLDALERIKNDPQARAECSHKRSHPSCCHKHARAPC